MYAIKSWYYLKMQFSIKSFVTQLILFSDLNGDLHNELSKECLLKKIMILHFHMITKVVPCIDKNKLPNSCLLLLRFKIKHSPRPKEKNNTLGYPIMKKEKPKELGSKDP